MNNYDELPLYDKLLKKVYAYYQTIWKEKWKEGIDTEWLNNFQNTDEDLKQQERLNMLYLLSKFMYFGSEELRQLLFSLYRDLFKYPIVEKIRRNNGDTTNITTINTEFAKELLCTRFLGVGNPSESGVHMLYYFRQECKLSKEFFINTGDIFFTSQITESLPDGSERSYLKSEISQNHIRRYVFIDDFCGSGDQATTYLKNIVSSIKFEDSSIEVNYLMLFSTEPGLRELKKLGIFNNVDAVFTLDETFKAFSENSRYYKVLPDTSIDKAFAAATADKYGRPLCHAPLGYGDCQLLIGFHHNTPDNSLPIFWCNKNSWTPIFKRYNKIY